MDVGHTSTKPRRIGRRTIRIVPNRLYSWDSRRTPSLVTSSLDHSLYRDFVTTAHARFRKFTRRSDINFNPQSDSDEVKEGTVEDFRYLEGTVHWDDANGLVYKTTRVVEENYPRRGAFFVVYRR